MCSVAEAMLGQLGWDQTRERCTVGRNPSTVSALVLPRPRTLALPPPHTRALALTSLQPRQRAAPALRASAAASAASDWRLMRSFFSFLGHFVSPARVVCARAPSRAQTRTHAGGAALGKHTHICGEGGNLAGMAWVMGSLLGWHAHYQGGTHTHSTHGHARLGGARSSSSGGSRLASWRQQLRLFKGRGALACFPAWRRAHIRAAAAAPPFSCCCREDTHTRWARAQEPPFLLGQAVCGVNYL